MKRSILIALMFLGACAHAQELSDAVHSFLPQQSAQAQREDELYKDGTDFRDEGKWDQAAQKFKQVADLKGRRADAALYWRAYVLNKAGNRTDAASSLGQLRTQYPKSTWLKDATTMEMEWRQGRGSGEGVVGGVSGGVIGGVPGGVGIGSGRGSGRGRGDREENNPDDDIKAQALFGLMNNDPERGVSICQDIMKNPNQSAKLKERCLFLLAQNDSPKANEVIMGVAKGNSGPDLQVRAIRNLGVSGDRYIPALTEIYAASTAPEVKKAVLGAYMTSGAKSELLKAINTEKDPEMRRRAIRQLGPMGASKELEQLYGSTQSPDDQEAIIQALAITGDTALLSRIAKTGATIDVRKRAIRSLGITGDKSHALLLDIFNNDKDPEIRKTVTDALFVSGGCAEMVTLARKEADYDVKKSLINKISLMNCKEGRDYMMELLK
jgi:tetratricopeptide (TPR) repeat protein